MLLFGALKLSTIKFYRNTHCYGIYVNVYSLRERLPCSTCALSATFRSVPRVCTGGAHTSEREKDRILQVFFVAQFDSIDFQLGQNSVQRLFYYSTSQATNVRTRFMLESVTKLARIRTTSYQSPGCIQISVHLIRKSICTCSCVYRRERPVVDERRSVYSTCCFEFLQNGR